MCRLLLHLGECGDLTALLCLFTWLWYGCKESFVWFYVLAPEICKILPLFFIEKRDLGKGVADLAKFGISRGDLKTLIHL